MHPQKLKYLTNRADQEEKAAKIAGCAESRLVHFDLASRYRMQARSIELARED